MWPVSQQWQIRTCIISTGACKIQEVAWQCRTDVPNYRIGRFGRTNMLRRYTYRATSATVHVRNIICDNKCHLRHMEDSISSNCDWTWWLLESVGRPLGGTRIGNSCVARAAIEEIARGGGELGRRVQRTKVHSAIMASYYGTPPFRSCGERRKGLRKSSVICCFCVM